MDFQQALEIAKTITPEQLEAINTIALPSAIMLMVILTAIEVFCDVSDYIIDKRKQKKTKPSE